MALQVTELLLGKHPVKELETEKGQAVASSIKMMPPQSVHTKKHH